MKTRLTLESNSSFLSSNIVFLFFGFSFFDFLLCTPRINKVDFMPRGVGRKVALIGLIHSWSWVTFDALGGLGVVKLLFLLTNSPISLNEN